MTLALLLPSGRSLDHLKPPSVSSDTIPIFLLVINSFISTLIWTRNKPGMGPKVLNDWCGKSGL